MFFKIHTPTAYLTHSFLIFIVIFLFNSLQANPEQTFPVLYKGRYRPIEAYARLWLHEHYYASALKQSDLSLFLTSSSSPLTFLWSLQFLGHTPYQSAPLFWITSAEIKQLAQLPLTQNRFSYNELYSFLHTPEKGEEISKQDKKVGEEWTTLLHSLQEFEQLQKGPTLMEHAWQERLAQLQARAISPKEIEFILEQDYPLLQRLQTAGTLFKALPSRVQTNEWFSLKALKVQQYHASSQSVKEIGNFTAFSDAHFEAIRQAYFSLEKAFIASSSPGVLQKNQQHLALTLVNAYQSLAGKAFQEAHGKQLTYPTLRQLKLENFYVRYPWILLLILFYAIAACLWMAYSQTSLPTLYLAAMGVTGMAIFGHTTLLAMRCYILKRPPVSNMFETVIYVPWVATCVSLLFPFFRRQPLVLIAACLTSIILLLILEITSLNQSLEQIQAVLDSQFWLMVHVLLVVGSYGVFILGALLGHFYLGLFIAYRKETPSMKVITPLILQTLYGGTALLVGGTILGGIWAAESWGRFWDWDPKESWAFISSCFYLIWIHAYRFQRIASFGLAIGAVSGLLAISFTWYGVNYILGTGLHSYGFGSGGTHYYYLFLGVEVLFLTVSLWFYFRNYLKDKALHKLNYSK